MDYTPIQAFLVGRCGKSLKESARTSLEEYELLADGFIKTEQEAWERLRWQVFMEWAISPNLKRRPKTPQDITWFPWEKEPVIERQIEPLTEDEIQQLGKIFGISRENFTNG